MNMIGIRKPPAGTWSISRIRRISGVTYRERIREANEVLADSKLTFDELEKMVKKIRRNFPALKLVEKYINEFIPIKKREVKNIYDKDKKEDGICIVVEGTENGKFWDREEWERENGKIE